MTFVEMLSAVRSNAGYSQKQLAKSLGVSPQYLSDLECGRRMPSVEVINKICNWMDRGPIGNREWHIAGARSHGWNI